MLVSVLLKEDVVIRKVDLAGLSRSSSGFDWLFDMLENARQSEPGENDPPYDIEKPRKDAYGITFATAGFSPAELSILTQPNIPIVPGKKAQPRAGVHGVITFKDEKKSERNSAVYSERGHGQSQRSPRLGPDVDPEQASASFKDGMPTLALATRPEAQSQVKRILISNT